MVVPLATVRFRSLESDTAAPPDLKDFGEAVFSFIAKAQQACDEFFTDAQGQLMDEIDFLRQETEALKGHVVSLVTDLVSRMDLLDQRYSREATAQTECDGQVKDRRRDVNSLIKNRAETALEMDSA